MSLNDVMNPLQFGFRKGFSTHDALLNLTESIRYEIDKNKIVHCALLDLSKAFDSICHQKLLSKLSQTGFDNNAVKMIAHYLTNRYQRVNVNGVFSSWYKVKRGFPQGTVLGPLLFNLYVNDFAAQIAIESNNTKIIQYADDCLLFNADINSSSAKDGLEKILNNICIYFKQHELNLNAKKSEYICFSEKCDPRINLLDKLLIDNTEIKQSRECKYLGIFLDQNLTSQTQVKRILQKMALGIKTIDTIRKQLPSKSLYTLFQSIVLFHLA